MKMFCKDLKEQAMKIINYKKKEMIPLTDEEKEAHENSEVCYICEKEFCTDEDNKEEFKKYKKLEITVITQENTEVLHIAFVIYATQYQKRFL